MNKIKNTDMDALSKSVVILALFDLAGIYFPQIKQYPVRPAVKIRHLHLHIHFRTVLKFYQNVKNPQLIFFAFFLKSCGDQCSSSDRPGRFSQNCRNKSFSHFRILHQFFKTEIHGGKHDKVITVSSAFLCTHIFFLLILPRCFLR